MSKESTKAAFQKAFSDHMLLNLSPEEEDSLRTYGKSEERIRMEQQLRSGLDKPTPSESAEELLDNPFLFS